MQLGLEPGCARGVPHRQRADTWCAGVAAQSSRLAITWLHPLGSLDDQTVSNRGFGSADTGY